MDINYKLGDLKFVWDKNKAEINWKKHKVSFKTATEIFLDENRIEDFDEFNSNDEERIKVIGMVEKILVVIYTERGDRNRIISARLADKDERDEYYEQFYY